MKKGLTLIGGVLLPFAAVVALGFYLLRDAPIPVTEPIVVEAPPVERAPSPEPPPAPPPAARADPTPPPAPTSAPPAPVEPTRLAPMPRRVSKPPPEDEAELLRKPWLRQVDHLVRQCFDDYREQFREPQRLTVTFDLTADGKFKDVGIRRSSWPDPQLAACVLDSFELATFDPAGSQMRRQAHTFTFSPADAAP